MNEKPENARFYELLDALEVEVAALRAAGEDAPSGLRALLDRVEQPLQQLSQQHTAAIIEAMDEAILHQGKVIMAAISGDLVAWPGCMPTWNPGHSSSDPLGTEPFDVREELSRARATLARMERMAETETGVMA